MKCLNLGCGTRFHPDWINLDSVAHNETVIKHDLQKGIPFEDVSFDVIYQSHVLEHFSQEAGQQLILECYRVLRPQGILRVVVPDLEQITRTYLLALENCLAGDLSWQANYDWMLLELLDQCSRNQSGGEMLRYFSQSTHINMDFVTKRIGKEAESIAAMVKAQQCSLQSLIALRNWKATAKYSLWQMRELLYRFLLRSDYDALKIGRLRKSGEIHYQMYDRFSLQRLLTNCGFVDIQLCSATQSKISNWVTMHLDTGPDGRTYKPDSLFIEAQKP